jgi:hypothetical protein
MSTANILAAMLRDQEEARKKKEAEKKRKEVELKNK